MHLHDRDRLLERVQAGETVSGACRQLGIPRATAYSWKARNPEFSRELSAAVAANRTVATPAFGDWRDDAAWLEECAPEQLGRAGPASRLGHRRAGLTQRRR